MIYAKYRKLSVEQEMPLPNKALRKKGGIQIQIRGIVTSYEQQEKLRRLNFVQILTELKTCDLRTIMKYKFRNN